MASVGNKNIAAMRGRAGGIVPEVDLCGNEIPQKRNFPKTKKRLANLLFASLFFVPREGVEPSRYRYRRILSPLRLPIPPSGQKFCLCLSFDKFSVKSRFFSPDSQAQFFHFVFYCL